MLEDQAMLASLWSTGVYKKDLAADEYVVPWSCPSFHMNVHPSYWCKILLSMWGKDNRVSLQGELGQLVRLDLLVPTLPVGGYSLPQRFGGGSHGIEHVEFLYAPYSRTEFSQHFSVTWITDGRTSQRFGADS